MDENGTRDDGTGNAPATPLFRRQLLTGMGLVGLGAMGSARADGSGSVDTSGENHFANHDHSGEFGETSRLGEEAPVESITVEDLQTAKTPLVDVRAHGVVGDGATDDSLAFESAIQEATPHGVLYVPADVRMRLTRPVEIDLSGAGHNRFSFICHGAISPSGGTGKAITITDAAYIYVFLRVDGGGRDVESDTALRLENSRASLLEGQANGFSGRVFEVEDSATYSIGFLRTQSCGQSLGVFSASPMGEFRDGFDVSPTRAPAFHNTSDIQINQYENFVSQENERGMLFQNCLSVFADKIAVGGNADVPIFETRNVRNACFNGVHLGGAPNVGAVIENTRNTSFQIFCNQCTTGVTYTGSQSRSNRIILNAKDIGQAALQVTENVVGSGNYFAGNVEDGRFGVEIQSADARIHLNDFYSTRCFTDLVVPEGNDVRVANSVFATVDGQPRVYNGLAVEEDANFPRPGELEIGTSLLFTDSLDGSKSGLYLLAADDTWYRIDDGERFVFDPDESEFERVDGENGDDESDALPAPGLVGTAAGVGAAGYLWSQWRQPETGTGSDGVD